MVITSLSVCHVFTSCTAQQLFQKRENGFGMCTTQLNLEASDMSYVSAPIQENKWFNHFMSGKCRMHKYKPFQVSVAKNMG